MISGSWCLTEILMSWKPCSSNRLASHFADSTRAAGVALPPYFASMRGSSEPALTPMRIGVPWSFAASAISLTWSSNFLMLPGLTRTAAQPGLDRSEHVLRLEVDVGDHRDLRLLRDDRQRVGVVLARHRDPHDLAAGRRELGDLLKRRVDVGGQRDAHRLHRDRRVAADQDPADVDLPRHAPRRERAHERHLGQTQIDGGHGLRTSRFGPAVHY